MFYRYILLLKCFLLTSMHTKGNHNGPSNFSVRHTRGSVESILKNHLSRRKLPVRLHVVCQVRRVHHEPTEDDLYGTPRVFQASDEYSNKSRVACVGLLC